MAEYRAYKDDVPGSKRAPCLGCGDTVIHARDRHVLVGGKRDGSLLILIDARPQISLATDPDLLASETDLELLGVAHRECADRARKRLEAQEVELPVHLPKLEIEEDSNPPPPRLHLPPSMGECPFCGADADSDEHVLARWISRELTKQGGLVRSSPWGTEPVRSVNVTAPVCSRCNHRWLSVLENDVRPFLAPLIRGETGSIAPQEQELLATWAVKTALMFDLASGSPIVPSGFYYDLRQRRSALASNVVWMGAYLGSRWALWVRGKGLHVGISENDPPNAFTMTFSIFRVIFQVAGHFTVGGAEIADRRPLAAALARIWPSPAGVLAWPPNGLAFGDDRLDDLAESISG